MGVVERVGCLCCQECHGSYSCAQQCVSAHLDHSRCGSRCWWGRAFLLQGFHCTGGVGYSTIAICGLLPLIMLGLHLMLLMGWVQFGFWVSDVDPIINLARYIGHGPRYHDHVLGLILDVILHFMLLFYIKFRCLNRKSDEKKKRWFCKLYWFKE